VDHGCLLSKSRQMTLQSSPVEACLQEIRSDERIKGLLAQEKQNYSHKFFEVINPTKYYFFINKEISLNLNLFTPSLLHFGLKIF
jgi:hypothetical protein